LHRALQPLLEATEQVLELDERKRLRTTVRIDSGGGSVEIEIKEDKQGLASSKRNKRRFEAQQVLSQLEALAHNVLRWACHWLAPHCPKIARWGIRRLGSGLLIWDQALDLLQIALNQADPFAKELSTRLAVLLAQEHVAVSLGET
jgi:hypothetical protein